MSDFPNLLRGTQQSASGIDVLSTAGTNRSENSMRGQEVTELLHLLIIHPMQWDVWNLVETDEVDTAVKPFQELDDRLGMLHTVVHTLEDDILERETTLVREVIVAQQLHYLLDAHSLHGPVWRNNLNYFIEKHDKWSKYEPEDQAVAIIYGSIYGNTEQAADALAAKLGAKGVKNIAVYDASKTDVSELIAEIFRVSHVVIACPTYNGGIYPPIENLLAHMKALAVQNRTVAVMDNGTWAATAGKQIVKQLEEMKNMTVLDQKLSIKSTLKADQEDNLDAFAQQIIDAM